jgi:beta-galactosidase
VSSDAAVDAAAGGADAAGSPGSGGAGGAGGSGGAPVQVYDGQRGKSFNDGWKFYLGDATGAQTPGFNDSSWTSLSVPHDWTPALGMSQSSPGGSGEGYSIGGIGWYRKTFTLDSASAGKTIFIAFDGVYANSQVWINGTSLGTWPYGYTSFQYDLTPYVKTDGSNNVVAVRVNNKQPSSRWYTGSGIYRNVWLAMLSPVHVAFNGAFITTPAVSTTSATVSVATEVENLGTSPASVKVKTSLLDASGMVVAADTSPASDVPSGGKATTVTQSLTVSNPKLWSLESPTLHQARIEVQVGGETVDTYVSSIGLRWTKFDPNSGFFLNDKAIKIWGVCDHHDLGAIGSAVNVRAIERQLQILKGMGTNGIRTSHNPPAPELLALADRMGILIMDEAFDVWEQGKVTNDYHVYFNDWAQRDIQAYVRRDRNHPSVIMWSIGNEIGGATAATGQKLRDWVKAIDTTRPVTWGANHMKSDAGQRAVAALLDLQGYNYFVGDANSDTGNLVIDTDHKSNANWKIFGSEELSNVKSRGVYTTQNTNLHWTGCNNQQCSSYDIGWGDGFNTEEMLLLNMKRPWFFGQFDWTGFDYGGEPTPYTWPSKSSYFGTIDTAGFPKDIYYFYQSKLTGDPMVHLLPHWNWSAGTTVWVWAYSNCDSVELFLNDKSQGSKTVAADTTRLEWNVAWASGTLRAEGKRNGTVVAIQEIRTAGTAAQIKLTADRTAIAADGRDLVFVTADIQDGSGVFVPTANSSVSFAVSGPGKLVGVDNGDATDTTSYTSPKRNAFNGKALAIVQSTGQVGQITVTATSSGLTQGTVSATAN